MADRTPGQTIGPFFADALTFPESHRLVHDGYPGAIRLHGTVYDGAGEPVDDALVEVWQPRYAGSGFGRCATDSAGHYTFTTLKPPMFFTFAVFARGLLDRLFTRAYLPGTDPALPGLDPQRRHTLMAVTDAGGYRFDIHLQGQRETVFLDYRGGTS